MTSQRTLAGMLAAAVLVLSFGVARAELRNTDARHVEMLRADLRQEQATVAQLRAELDDPGCPPERQSAGSVGE